MDFHLHTSYSDGSMTPEQVVDWAFLNGYNIIVITDHNELHGALIAEKYALKKYKNSLIVIPGVEYTNCRVHMNLINIRKLSNLYGAYPSDEEIQTIIKQTHKNGGIAILNHIPWSHHIQFGKTNSRLSQHPSVTQAIKWGIDGIEIINENIYDQYTLNFLNKNDQQLLKVTGTDLHNPGSAYAWSLLPKTVPLTTKGVMNYLKNKTNTIDHIFYPIGTPTIVHPKFNPKHAYVIPLMILANVFGSFFTLDQGMYSFHGSFCHQETLTVHYFSIFVFYLFLYLCLLIIDGFSLLFKWVMPRNNNFRYALLRQYSRSP
ncbi:PHP domain-like protein [Neoconidiobolus thromboides FSU 785]|nr:PHP domain-like protein [Neoconidiobolus thromboides FSU 785]